MRVVDAGNRLAPAGWGRCRTARLLHYPRLEDGRARLIGRGSATGGDRQRRRSVMNSNYRLIVANSLRGDTLQVQLEMR